MSLRPISPGMEKILEKRFDVLDKGFVRVVDYMGNDGAVVQAARVSYGAGTKKVSEDSALISYLMRHKHTTPFEMCELKLHIKLPIFVARQWIRHRTASVNEYSGRYSVMDEDYYVPDEKTVCFQSADNKQGRGEALSRFEAVKTCDMIREDARVCREHYDKMISKGVSREIARICLPVSSYTQWYWKTDLHNLFNFLRLRTAPNAQYEIRQYATLILNEIVCPWVPICFDAFRKYLIGGVLLSGPQKRFIKSALRGENPDFSDMSDREAKEFKEIFDI